MKYLLPLAIFFGFSGATNLLVPAADAFDPTQEVQKFIHPAQKSLIEAPESVGPREVGQKVGSWFNEKICQWLLPEKRLIDDPAYRDISKDNPLYKDASAEDIERYRYYYERYHNHLRMVELMKFISVMGAKQSAEFLKGFREEFVQLTSNPQKPSGQDEDIARRGLVRLLEELNTTQGREVLLPEIKAFTENFENTMEPGYGPRNNRVPGNPEWGYGHRQGIYILDFGGRDIKEPAFKWINNFSGLFFSIMRANEKRPLCNPWQDKDQQVSLRNEIELGQAALEKKLNQLKEIEIKKTPEASSPHSRAVGDSIENHPELISIPWASDEMKEFSERLTRSNFLSFPLRKPSAIDADGDGKWEELLKMVNAARDERSKYFDGTCISVDSAKGKREKPSASYTFMMAKSFVRNLCAPAMQSIRQKAAFSGYYGATHPETVLRNRPRDILAMPGEMGISKDLAQSDHPDLRMAGRYSVFYSMLRTESEGSPTLGAFGTSGKCREAGMAQNSVDSLDDIILPRGGVKNKKKSSPAPSEALSTLFEKYMLRAHEVLSAPESAKNKGSFDALCGASDVDADYFENLKKLRTIDPRNWMLEGAPLSPKNYNVEANYKRLKTLLLASSGQKALALRCASLAAEQSFRGNWGTLQTCFNALSQFCPNFALDYGIMMLSVNRGIHGPTRVPRKPQAACMGLFREIVKNKENLCRID